MNIDDTIKTIESAIPEETKYQEWQPIKDTLELNDPPPFPVEALPPVLRDMAEGISSGCHGFRLRFFVADANDCSILL